MNDKEWQKILWKAAEDIYENRKRGIINEQMVSATAQHLMGGIEIGFGEKMDTEALPQRKYDVLQKLTLDVYHFSGAKNYNQLKEMSHLLTGYSGKRPSFKQFFADVQKIDETYNKVYLRAEYEHAVASAQMTAKWEDIAADADVLPYLQYDAVMDERTRITHRELNGIIRRWDDDFWKQYYPPNDWGCRCDVRQLDEAAETDLSQRKIAPNKPFFQNNVGIGGQAFTDKHPYYHTLKDNVEKKKVFIASERLMPNDMRNGFKEEYKNTRNKKRLLVHTNADKEGVELNKEYGKIFVDEGYNVKILPHSFVDGVKNPEVAINNIVCDFKTPNKFTSTSIQSQVKRANKQEANGVAIHINPAFKLKDIILGLESSFGKNKGWEWNKRIEVIYLFNQKVLKIQRSEVISGTAKRKIAAFLKKQRGG